LSQLKAALPRKRARQAWLRLLAAAQQAAWQQQLREMQRQEAVLAIQSAYRAWQVRRVTAKQLAGVRRFQVRNLPPSGQVTAARQLQDEPASVGHHFDAVTDLLFMDGLCACGQDKLLQT
jgi:hypothetical protein